MKRLTLNFTALAALFITGCSKPRDLIAEDRAYIASRIAAATTIDQVQPPIGPFKLVRPSSRYWRVKVEQTDETYWVESRISMWSAVSGSDVYVYDIYQKVPLVDVYRRVKR